MGVRRNQNVKIKIRTGQETRILLPIPIYIISFFHSLLSIQLVWEEL